MLQNDTIQSLSLRQAVAKQLLTLDEATKLEALRMAVVQAASNQPAQNQAIA